MDALERKMLKIEDRIKRSQAAVLSIWEDLSESSTDTRILLQRLTRMLGREVEDVKMKTW